MPRLSASREVFIAVFGWLWALTLLAVLLRDSSVNSLFPAAILVSWMVLGLAQMIESFSFKGLLEVRAPAVIERRSIGSLFFGFNGYRLLGATQDADVLSDDILRPRALRLAALEYAAFAWFGMVWLGGLLLMSAVSVVRGESATVLAAAMMLGFAALIFVPAYHAFRGPQPRTSVEQADRADNTPRVR